MALVSINPTTGEPVAEYPETTEAELEAALASARQAFPLWIALGFRARGDVLRRAATSLRTRREALARLMAIEMGKPLAQGRAEADKCAWVLEHYAEHADSMLADEDVATDATRSFVTFRPLGAILAVMPWNFPLWQVYRFAAPALMAGNVALLKHASNVSGCALAIEQIFRGAGTPEGVFRTLILPSRRMAGVIDSADIAAVTLTGSTPAGRAVASAAGAALKKTVLELGGSDPYVILEDADLEGAAETCAAARLINGGQSCIAAKRFVVVDSVRPAFETLLVERMRARRMGNPLDEATEVGPQARADLRDELHAQVLGSIRLGARLLLGGHVPPRPGAFYPPTVLAGVRKGMPVFDEETFGPVAAIVPVRDEDEAVEAANDSRFGLGAAVFTRDVARGERLAAERIQAGSCFVNASVRSDPRLPFGGIKDSGYGRELSAFGIREFVNVKTVYIR
jgi:succinate-semialdehyde dehydrogenase / glutarate-semialdehyde dehydrogenase